MVRFKELIHKETNTIISYGDWLKHIQEDKIMIFAITEESSWRYNPKNMLLSDDFDVIYEPIEKERLLKLLKYSKEAIEYWFNGCGDSPEECINENDYFKEEVKYFIDNLSE